MVCEDLKKLEADGKPSGSALRVFQFVQRRPILTTSLAARELRVSFPTASKAIDRLVEVGILNEVDAASRPRKWSYGRYLEIQTEE